MTQTHFNICSAFKVGPDIGLLHWDAPLRLSDSVADYVVHVRKMTPTKERADREFTSTRNTFVLENLSPESTYEVCILKQFSRIYFDLLERNL